MAAPTNAKPVNISDAGSGVGDPNWKSKTKLPVPNVVPSNPMAGPDSASAWKP
jgi:hypothetical protein